MSCCGLSFSFTALYCTMNQWRKQNRPKKCEKFFGWFVVVFSSWVYFFWMLQDPELTVLLSYKAQMRRHKFSLAGLVHQGWDKQLVKNGDIFHGLVTKRTYSVVTNFIGFSSHAISCALLPQVVFEIFSTNWNMV